MPNNKPSWSEIYQELINAGLRSANHGTKLPLEWSLAKWQEFFKDMAKLTTNAYVTGCDEVDRATKAGLIAPEETYENWGPL